MFTKHVSKELSAYCQGELGSDDSRRVAEHILGCRRCRKDLEEIKLGIQFAERITHAPAPASLWREIESLLDQQSIPQRRLSRRRSWVSWRNAGLAAAAVIVTVIVVVSWYAIHSQDAPWEVVRLAGNPTINSDRIGDEGSLGVGEWLNTDASSRAQVKVANIGEVEVEPNSRLRLVKTQINEHRVELARGSMQARIWAPPKLFFVNTPSAVAVDHGCAYTLDVDDAGATMLHVTMGWVALVLGGRESMVPTGGRCDTRPEIGPGTPYFDDASEALKKALAKLDFEAGAEEALSIVLAQSRPLDTLTLWHLLPRLTRPQRERVYDRMVLLIAPPAGVTREGVINLDETMLDIWREQLKPVWQRDDPAIWKKLLGSVGN
ncbi:MAG: hypothetical protein DMF61_10950 [Blastocatellia bacterium AA13]|nr:MAG: hypothetical protein DMF61_10950 [Blastocatellia bacterium AA13]